MKQWELNPNIIFSHLMGQKEGETVFYRLYIDKLHFLPTNPLRWTPLDIVCCCNSEKEILNLYLREGGQWPVYNTSPEIFLITFSYSLT